MMFFICSLSNGNAYRPIGLALLLVIFHVRKLRETGKSARGFRRLTFFPLLVYIIAFICKVVK